MRILVVGKYPPIQGGVSGQTYWLLRALAGLGHRVSIVTNAGEVEPWFRQLHFGDDSDWLNIPGLTVFSSLPLSDRSYIPWAEPFASKLFGRCMQVMGGERFDFILGSYFEPYGLVAAIVGAASRTPVFLRHAGSDVARLAQHPELKSAYRWMLDRAAGLISPNMDELTAALGPADKQIIRMPRPRLPEVFFSDSAPLDVSLILRNASEWFGSLQMDSGAIEWLMNQHTRRFDKSKFTLGVYGKVGEAKGTFDLLSALERLASDGREFNLISLSAGRPNTLRRFLAQVRSSDALSRSTWMLPPLAPWRVPTFVAGCHAVAFLERDFSVKFHGPSVPREVIAIGACLLVSGEIASNQDGRAGIAHKRNAFVCMNPANVAELSNVLAEMIDCRETTEAFARQGKILSKAWEYQMPTYQAAAETLLEQLQQVL